MLRYADRMVGKAARSPQFRPIRLVECTLDAPWKELDSAGDREHAARIGHWAMTEWGSVYRATYLLPAFCLPVGELSLFVEVDPDAPPGAAALRLLVERHSGTCASGTRIAEIFILLRSCACHTGLRHFMGTPHRILSPGTHPEVFCALGRPEFKVHGEGAPRKHTPALTGAMREIATTNLHQAEFDASEAGGWKARQMRLFLRSVKTGVLRFPMTVGAIERAERDLGHSLPPSVSLATPR
jgi:hypothetical protein